MDHFKNIYNRFELQANVPLVEKCCFCFPLRVGVITIAYLTVFISIPLIICILFASEFKNSAIHSLIPIDVKYATVLGCILGLLIILNSVLIIGLNTKDIILLNLFNFYTLGMVVLGIIHIFLLLHNLLLYEAAAMFIAICVQIYINVLVRSAIFQLKNNVSNASDNDGQANTFDYVSFV